MKLKKNHLKGTLLCILAMTLTLSGANALAAILEVPSATHPTIQSAIDAASDGDTVEVGDGTFSGNGNKDLDFKGKAITVKSKNGPDKTIIDCERNGRGVYFHNDEDEISVFSGFTITNGNQSFGGGIWCYSASPTIKNCRITGNAAYSSNGGGINLTFSSPKIINCDVSGNTALSSGGGIGCHTSSPVIENSTINQNKATSGGGIDCTTTSSITISNSIIDGNTAITGRGGGIYGGEIDAENCTINNNSAERAGGGVYTCNPDISVFDACAINNNSAGTNGGGIYCGSLTLANCTISNNTAASDGGGLHGYSTTLTGCTLESNTATSGKGGGAYFSGSSTLDGCTINKNTAAQDGGGICFFSSFHAGAMVKCIISQNSALRGGGIYCDSSTITNCLITENTADQVGGGIYCIGHATPTIMNTTVSQNSAESGGGLYCSDYGSPTVTNSIFWTDTPDEIYYMEHFSNIVVNYSDVQGFFSGFGNINADPLFVGSGNYNLTENSPCIDVGASDGAPNEDLIGTPRPQEGGNDLGAYEYSSGAFTGCLSFSDNYSIPIPCIDFMGSKLSFTFDYSHDLVFEVDVSTVTPSNASKCMAFEDDFSIKVPCFNFNDASFNFTFHYIGDLYWEVR